MSNAADRLKDGLVDESATPKAAAGRYIRGIRNIPVTVGVVVDALMFVNSPLRYCFHVSAAQHILVYDTFLQCFLLFQVLVYLWLTILMNLGIVS